MQQQSCVKRGCKVGLNPAKITQMSDPPPAKCVNEPTQVSSNKEDSSGLSSSFSSSRRGFLTSTALVAGGLLSGVQNSDAFFFFSGKSNLNVDELPQEWVKSQGDELQAYARHIAKYRLEKLTVHELIKAHARQKGSVWNQIPPRETWERMGPTLKVADQLTIALGVGLTEITSAYRSPEYNARCPGAKPRSFHQQNIALDLMFNTSPSRVARVARELRDNGLFEGGVGRYSLFTHIDTRGYNATW